MASGMGRIIICMCKCRLSALQLAASALELCVTARTHAAPASWRRIVAALQDIQKSPWKTIKYVFDREVMEVSITACVRHLPLPPCRQHGSDIRAL